MAGRKPTPIEILKTTGGLRKHRHGSVSGPAVDSGVPECPNRLSDSARRAWGEIVPLLAARRVLTLADAAALEVLAVTLAEWREHVEVLASEGATYKCTTESGAAMYRPHPRQAMKADAQRRLAAALASFGLDPSSRSKIASLPAETKNKFAALGGGA